MILMGRSLLIKADKRKESIIIIDEDTSPLPYATIILTGEDITNKNLLPGNRIYYNNRAGRFIEIDKEEHLLISDTDVFIVFDESTK